MRTLIITIAVMVLASGCSRDGKKAGDRPGAVAGVLVAWKLAGLEPKGFQKVDSLEGGRCERGSVGEIETTLCAFHDEETARKAQAAGLSAIGDVTGASLAEGKLLLVVADRKRADPSGRRLNEIARTFRKR
ncbi:MAG: hypothetical protein HY698_21180 [Deltaproteobacteria bacterium]|nr:hypothetical protein [Deltaproteobacteria bacterium]